MEQYPRKMLPKLKVTAFSDVIICFRRAFCLGLKEMLLNCIFCHKLINIALLLGPATEWHHELPEPNPKTWKTLLWWLEMKRQNTKRLEHRTEVSRLERVDDGAAAGDCCHRRSFVREQRRRPVICFLLEMVVEMSSVRWVTVNCGLRAFCDLCNTLNLLQVRMNPTSLNEQKQEHDGIFDFHVWRFLTEFDIYWLLVSMNIFLDIHDKEKHSLLEIRHPWR